MVEYIRYSIGAERVDAFLGAYDFASDSLRQSPACLAYELSRCSEAPEAFIFRIEWRSTEAHLEGFRRSAEFKVFFQAINPYVGDIEEMRHYEPTAMLWRRRGPPRAMPMTFQAKARVAFAGSVFCAASSLDVRHDGILFGESGGRARKHREH